MKTLERVSEKRELEAEAQEQKAAEQRQRVRERLASLRGGVDLVVDDSRKAQPAESSAKPKVEAPTSGIDIEV